MTRAGAATGRATGNVLAEAGDRASNLALQDYGNYVSRLSPFLGAAQGAAAGQAGVYTGMGGALNQNYMGQGNLGYNAYGQMGQNNAAAIEDQLRAQKQGWDAIGEGVKLGTKILGAF